MNIIWPYVSDAKILPDCTAVVGWPCGLRFTANSAGETQTALRRNELLRPARRRSFIMWKIIIPRALLAVILLGSLDIALAQWLRQLNANPCAPDSTANPSALMASPVDRNRSAIPMGIRELLVSMQREQPVSPQCAEALRSVGQLSRRSERQPVRSGPGGQPLRTLRHSGLARRHRQSVPCPESEPCWQPQQRVPLGLVDPG